MRFNFDIMTPTNMVLFSIIIVILAIGVCLVVDAMNIHKPTTKVYSLYHTSNISNKSVITNETGNNVVMAGAAASVIASSHSNALTEDEATSGAGAEPVEEEPVVEVEPPEG